MPYGDTRKKELKMSREAKSKLFDENIGAAFDSCKKLKKYYLFDDFDTSNPLIDEDEINQIILTCFWELIQRYKDDRNCALSTFTYMYLPQTVQRSIEGHKTQKIINNKKVYLNGAKDDFGLSRHRKGVKHLSLHSKLNNTKEGGKFYSQSDYVSNMLSIDGKIAEVDPDDIGQALIKLRDEKEKYQKSEEFIKSKLSTYQIICLRFGIGCEQLSVREITERSGITNSAVRLRIKRGIQRLSAILSEIKEARKRKSIYTLHMNSIKESIDNTAKLERKEKISKILTYEQSAVSAWKDSIKDLYKKLT